MEENKVIEEDIDVKEDETAGTDDMTDTAQSAERENEVEVSENAGEPEGEEEHGKRYPTQAVITIRAIVGAYLCYLAYQILTSGEEMSVFIWIFVVLFILAGAGLVVYSVKNLIAGEYEGGKRDNSL